MKYLAIGDSITAEKVDLTVYAEKLTPILLANRPDLFDGTYSTGYGQNVSVVNHGHKGWATQLFPNASGYTGFYETAALWKTESIDEAPDICSIYIGVNDHYSDTPYTQVRVSLVDYEANLNGMLDDLIASVPTCYIVMLTPSQIVTTSQEPLPQRSRTRLSTYVDVVVKVAGERGIELINLFDIFWELSGESETTFGSTYTTDGLHLNQDGQDIVTELLKATILNHTTGGYMVTNIENTPTAVYSVYNGKPFSQDGVNYYRGVADGDAVSVSPIGLTSYQEKGN